jgi:hypothetical protein
LPTDYGPRRTPDEVALLGTLPDDEVAAQSRRWPRSA